MIMKSGTAERAVCLREMRVKFNVMNQYIHRQMYLIKCNL